MTTQINNHYCQEINNKTCVSEENQKEVIISVLIILKEANSVR